MGMPVSLLVFPSLIMGSSIYTPHSSLNHGAWW